MNFRNFATAMMFLAAAAVHGADAWKPAAGNPVLSRGSFLNIHSPAILAEDGQYTLFFSGYWGALEIFRARSADGTAFTPEKSPAVPRDPEGQPGSWNVIGSPSVLKENGIYHIWFAGASDWNTPAAIGYASSPDGVTFSKYPGNAVLAATDGGAVASPSVLLEDGRFKMWYLATEKGGWKPRVCYAESDDGSEWTRRPAPVMESSPAFGGDILTSLCVRKNGTGYRMWYGVIGADRQCRIGEAASENGFDWKRSGTELFPGDNPSVLIDGDGLKLYYTYGDKAGIGLAEKREAALAPPAGKTAAEPGAAALPAVVPVEQGDDSPFGINCFQFPEMERELGAKYLRWEFAHQLIEPEQGRFDWERTDRIVSEAKAQDIRILGLISSTAKWNSTRPDAADYYSYAPRDHKALHAYVTAVVNRYKDYIKYWEIWNEPDLPYAWNGSHADFVRVMKTIYEAIKAADPEAKVAAMALDGGFAPFLDAVLAAGGGAYFDIYSDHTYVSGVELQARLAAVRNLLAKYNCVKPIWVTETGCNTTIEKRENETPEAEEVRWRNALRQQAREVVRQMVGLLAEGVEKIFVYQASRVGSRYDYENWGLLDEKGGILPAGAAFNLTVRMLYGKKFQNAFKYGQYARAFAFSDGREAVIVLWSDRDEKLKLNLGDAFTVTRIDGAVPEMSVADGFTELAVGPDPIFIAGLAPEIPGRQQSLTFPENPVTLLPGEARSVPLRIVNPFKHACTVELNVWAPPGSTAKSGNRRIELAAGATAEIPVEVELKTAPAKPLRLLASADFNRGFFKASAELEATAGAPVRLSIEPAGLSADGSLELAAGIANLSRKPRSGTLRVSADFPGTFQPEKADFSGVAPGESAQFRFRLSAREPLSNHNRLRLNGTLSGGEAFELERPVDFLLCARDGETAPPGAALNSAEQYYPVISDARWGGPKDLSGRLTAAWNDTSLRLSLEVTDDVHHQPFKADGPLFDGDSVQIGIDTLCNRSVNYDNDDYELCFGLTRNGPEFSVFAAPGGMAERLKKQAVFKAVREGEITRYDIELPWSALGVKPKRGMKLGFSFLVNDNDGAVRKGFLQWTSGIGPRKDPRQFGTLILW